MEKHPERGIDTVAALCAAGHDVRLLVAGDGPRRSALQRRAAGLPVRFLGFLPDRLALARLLASADVLLAPGPHETFGLSTLEALACGTPVVVSASSALPEVIGSSGAAALDTSADFAAGVTPVLAADTEAQGLPSLAQPSFGATALRSSTTYRAPPRSGSWSGS